MATFVLVHGSNQGGWIWKPVGERLSAAYGKRFTPRVRASWFVLTRHFITGMQHASLDDAPLMPFASRAAACHALRGDRYEADSS